MAKNQSSEQQSEALAYFRQVAEDWRKKAEGAKGGVNVIEERNNFVLSVARKRGRMQRSLDVGCGTGELAIALSEMGITAVGVDFAGEMVARAEQKAATQHAKNCRFVHTSIFDYRPSDMPYDLISANGFIEYISRNQLSEFLTQAYNWLNPGGALVVGSRNRLFNAVSMNQYTQLEIDRGALIDLVREAIVVASAATPEECIDHLVALKADLPVVEAHPGTGIGVATRHQYTPGELVRLFRSYEFRPVMVWPIHCHGAVPRFGGEHPELHAAISTTLQEQAAHYLIPFSSSFMIHAERC